MRQREDYRIGNQELQKNVDIKQDWINPTYN